MARLEGKHPEFMENILLVEGNDDLHVIANLCGANEIQARSHFEIIDGGGYEKLRESLSPRLKAGNQRRMGIVVDADTQLADRWASLRDLLRKAGYSSTPDNPVATGTILFPDVPEAENAEPPYRATIGVWIMPDNTLPGALEEFVRLLVPPERMALWDHAEASVAYLPLKPSLPTENWLAKARIHTYLAWHENPGTPMGQAITKKYLAGDAEATQPFIAWISRLFDITT